MCERNWNTYDFIHNKKRNRLRLDRANNLVEVFSNLRLISKVNNIEYEEQMVAWDGGEEELEEEWSMGELGKILDCIFFFVNLVC